jgi:hypothetical protein
LSGRAMARTGLRMMPTFPSLPLKSRTAGFPQYGFKAGMSDSAFPSTTWCSRRMVCICPSCTSLPESLYPGSESGNAVRGYTSVRAASAALPQGPSLRTELCCLGPSSLKTAPCAPLAGTPRFHRHGLYWVPSLCVQTATPRRPASGSELSLTVPCRHVAL